MNYVFLSSHGCGGTFHPWVAGKMVALAVAAVARRPVVVAAVVAQMLELHVHGPAHSLASVPE